MNTRRKASSMPITHSRCEGTPAALSGAVPSMEVTKTVTRGAGERQSRACGSRRIHVKRAWFGRPFEDSLFFDRVRASSL